MEDLHSSADFLERTSAATMRQVGICIAVLFLVVAVNLNNYVNWSQAYNSRDRAALLVLDQLYPGGGTNQAGATYDGHPLTGSINQRSNTYLGLVAKQLKVAATDTDRAILERHIESWKSGFSHLTSNLAPFYDLNSPEQRKSVRNLLEEDVKQSSDASRASNTFQLPLIGISFDSRDRSLVLGVAMLVVLGGLVFAVRREILVVRALLARHPLEDETRKLCLRQFIYLPDKAHVSRRAKINTLRTTACIPLLLQLLMVWDLRQAAWFGDVDKVAYDRMLCGGAALILLLGFLSIYTQSLLTRLWMAWDTALANPERQD